MIYFFFSPAGVYQISWQVRQLKTSALALSDHGHGTSGSNNYGLS